ncbi:MAG TPA: DedA family protein [Solirubrobacteraceae bacterium]|nr:DedA family protein [Solirubrobacteraceae bacterium]
MILAALFSLSSGLGYVLPAIIGLESMGVPSPGETALLLAAVLASQGHLQIWLVIVIASASAILGDNLAYGLGRWLGRDVLEAPGPLHRHRQTLIRVGDRFFARHGSRTVLLGRWVTVVRSVVAWLAGINEMPFHVFFFWNALGGITWATAYGLAGYFGGNAAVSVFKTVGLGAGIAIGVALVLAYVLYKLRERRRDMGEANAADAVPPGRDTAERDPEDEVNGSRSPETAS